MVEYIPFVAVRRVIYGVLEALLLTCRIEGPKVKPVGIRLVVPGGRYDDRPLSYVERASPLPVDKTAESYRGPLGAASS